MIPPVAFSLWDCRQGRREVHRPRSGRYSQEVVWHVEQRPLQRVHLVAVLAHDVAHGDLADLGQLFLGEPDRRLLRLVPGRGETGQTGVRHGSQGWRVRGGGGVGVSAHYRLIGSVCE